MDENDMCGARDIGGNRTAVHSNEGRADEIVEVDMPGIASGPRAELRSSIYENCIQEEQLFNSADAFREAVYKFSIAHHFPYKWIRNIATCFDVQCRVEGCKWRVTARRIKDTPFIKVQKFINEHQHDAGDHLNVQPLVRTKWIAGIIESTVKQTPNYLPQQIVKDLQQEFAVSVKYHQSWHSKERAMKNIVGDVADSYRLVPWMCKRLVEVMPGSVAICNITDDNRFYQLFIAYHCSLEGFRAGCQPLLFVDGTYLSGPYRGTLLAAIAIDAKNAMYPIAYAVVSSENHADWLWLLQNLKHALEDSRDIAIISDWHASIVEGVRAVFGSQNHAFCLRHLKENFSTWLGGKGLRRDAKDAAMNLLTAIAKARLPQDFDEKLKELDGVHPDCSTWVRNNSPQHWVNLFFPKKRWDIMSSNLAESYNGWVRMERQLPIQTFIEETRVKLGELLLRRHEEANGWDDLVGPNIAKEIKKNANFGRGWIVRKFNATEWEVEMMHGKKIAVDLGRKTCTCRKWETSGIPCEHACQVIERARLSVYQYVDPCYHKDAQIRIYSTLMRPVPNIDMPNIRSHNLDSNFNEQPPLISPPNSKRRAGRPKRKRIESQFMDKRTVFCKRCKKAGHNRRSCNEAI